MAKKANNEGSIRRRPNGTWEGRYSDGVTQEGNQIQRSVYGKTKKEVTDKLHTIFFQNVPDFDAQSTLKHESAFHPLCNPDKYNRFHLFD